MPYYKDLREHIRALEARGKLVRIRESINKDTELMPLVRWQFRGLEEEERAAFLFEQVTDSKGRRYDMSVLVGALAASREIYAVGMMCRPEEIMEKWARAELHPIPAVVVAEGPVHQVVHMGEELTREGGGLDLVPAPISTPGFDNAPYWPAGHWVTKDPETGIRNVGNYRVQVKARNRTGTFVHSFNDLVTHWKKCKARGNPLEAAVVVGPVPAVSYCAVGKFPYGVDEYGVAGGLAGEPIELVKCKTVDLEVPATAELVVEGRISIDELEPEGPHGEHTGYMSGRLLQPYLDVTCITHRKDAIFSCIISQFPPSESSKIRGLAEEYRMYKFLRYDCGLSGVQEVAFPESCGGRHMCVIRLRKVAKADAWQALYAAAARNPSIGKYFIAVDEDIDPHDAEAVNWALVMRTQPHQDLQVVVGRAPSPGEYSAAPPQETSMEVMTYPGPTGGSAVLIDATMPWGYPPIALPKKEYMERARWLWERLELPKLKPRAPWHGYSLGYWTAEDEEEAEMAARGDYYQVGERAAQKRVKA